MENLELPKSFDEFVDARKAGFLKVKEYVENGGHLVGMFCSYTPLELFDAAGVSVVGLCGTSNEPIADAEKVLPKNLCADQVELWICLHGKMPVYIFLRLYRWRDDMRRKKEDVRAAQRH